MIPPGTWAEAAREAAARWGTPLQLYDLDRLRQDAEALTTAFPEPWLRLYSLKANGLPPLIRSLPGMGYGATAVSGGELALAQRAGFTAGLTTLEGIGKSPADLRRAVRMARAGTPLLWVSIESMEEAAELARLGRAARLPARMDVLVRLNPGVRPETHRGLAVGSAASKFGVLAADLPGVVEAGGGPDGPLCWRGLHIHVGSQLGAVDAWRSAFRVALATLALQRAALPDFDTLDVGSGFPVDADPDAAPGPARFAEVAGEVLDEVPADARPARLAIEPGRAVVARSGMLLGRVLHVRDRAPRLVVLDAGMTELIRPALYGARHPITALTSGGRPSDGGDAAPGAWQPTRVDGPICESTDQLGEASLPPLERGDLVAIGLTGAYGSSMASTYNGRPRAVEVAWDGSDLILLRARGRRAALP